MSFLGNLLEQLTELRESLAYIANVVYNKEYWMMKTQMKSQSEVRESLKHRNFCPHGVGGATPPTPTWKLSKPCTSGIFMETSSRRCNQLIQSLALLPSPRRGWGKKF